MNDSIVIADEFLKLASKDGDTLTPMQLLKLVYIAHGWMLGLYGVPLINDEIQAWKYGPVIPRLYQAIKDFRGNPVTGLLKTDQCRDLLDLEKDLIGQVYLKYGKLSGIMLSNITHQVGSPWHTSYSKDEFGTVISNDLIEEYYSRLSSSSN